MMTQPPTKRPLSTRAILRTILPIAIFLLSIAPILFHDVSIHPISTLEHTLLRSSSSSNKKKKQQRRTTKITVQYYINETELFGSYKESQRNINLTFPPNIGSAGKSLLRHALTPRTIPDEAFNPLYEQYRCRKYFSYENYTKSFVDYNPPSNDTSSNTQRRRRRLFLGSLIADDSWHALAALAIESYGIYTAVVFVESNRTQTGTPRTLRFVKGSTEYNLLMERDIFGPETTIHLDYYTHEGSVDGGGLIREHRQRALILDLWKKAGMTKDDVGILSDADETPTRDFLRALQSCNFPELDVNQDCGAPKIVVASNVFEGSPECMTTTRKWMHPDVILGKCIEGIGDDEYKLSSRQRQREHAWRKDEYSAKMNYASWPKNKAQYPLWNPADFRRDTGGFVIYYEDVDYLPFRMGHTGYHFHNYFETTGQLRTKYGTYGHPVKGVENMSVSEIHPDLDLMADCVLGRPLEKNKHSTLGTRLAAFEGRVPIAYRLKGYSVARHLELRYILSEDERTWTAGTWHDTEKGKVTDG